MRYDENILIAEEKETCVFFEKLENDDSAVYGILMNPWIGSFFDYGDSIYFDAEKDKDFCLFLEKLIKESVFLDEMEITKPLVILQEEGKSPFSTIHGEVLFTIIKAKCPDVRCCLIMYPKERKLIAKLRAEKWLKEG